MTAGILLSVREKATRLPGKVLKPLGGTSVTGFLIRRLKTSRRAASVTVATSSDPRDQILCDIACAENVDFFRGSPDDKLRRYRDAARRFGFDSVVVVDGDDPFVSIDHIDALIDHAACVPIDFAIFDGLPLGATGFCVRTNALERICAGRPESDTEVWGQLFLKDPSFWCAKLVVDNPAHRRPDIRMTLDYPEDYEFFTAVVEGLAREGMEATFPNVMAFLADHPEVVAINRGVQVAYETHLKKSAQ